MLLGTQQINAEGHLEIGGCDTTRLASEFGTPLYVMDEADVRAKCRAFRAAFESRYPRITVYYASKALVTGAICRIMDEEGLSVDVASLGELYVALQSGFPAHRLALHGNNKSRDELEMAVENQIGHVVVDNLQELATLGEIARAYGREQAILLRVAPGVDPHTHRRIRTGQADTKFGLNITDGTAMQGVRQALETPGIRLRGIHCHVGSQLLDADTHRETADIMATLARDIRDETGIVIEELNIGGGFGVRYLPDQNPPSFDAFAEAICKPLLAAFDSANLTAPRLLLEPGRSLVGEAGTTLYTVGAIKTVPITETPGHRAYVSIDGGMSDNPRPQLYDAVYSCLLANKANQPADQIVTIAGKHCETDIMIWNTHVATPQSGDILAVQTTGAYNYAMASNYNRFLRPAVVLVNEGQADVIVARETLTDLVRQERVPARLEVAEAAKVNR